MDPVARTALWMAAARASETRRPDRLFDDPYAAALANGSQVAPTAGNTNANANGTGNLITSIRTRFYDDFLRRVTADAHIRQVVLLAAGMDARAYRMPWPAGTTLYELDRPELLTLKDEILDREGAVPACERVAVGVDLAGEWPAALLAAGYRREEPSVWLAEGLVFYLDDSAVHTLLARVAELAASGSHFGVDTINQGYLTSSWTATALQRFRDLGCPWLFGTDDPQALLAEYGWRAQVTQAGQWGTRYGRWSFPSVPRAVPHVPRWFFVTATRR